MILRMQLFNFARSTLVARGFATLKSSKFEYDLIVIGGGSGGLACAKEAAELGKKVVLFDYVDPTPIGTKWGLGGTCVNVGCIPKKLMHHAGLLGHNLKDARKYGWQVTDDSFSHKWDVLVGNVQTYIKSLNWGYRVQLQNKNVLYLNNYGSFVDGHTIKYVAKDGKENYLSGNNIVLAVGGRPKYPNIPGSELGISSDDLFSLKTPPGKTLVVGASYVALECAGFLSSLQMPTSLMMRSIPLRGFDQQMSHLALDSVKNTGCKIIERAVPSSLSKTKDGKIKVVGKYSDGKPVEDLFDNVFWAVGRSPQLKKVKLENANVVVDEKSGKVVVDKSDRTNVENIFAIGDVQLGRPELTPVAIMAGKLLAKRLFGGSIELMDYVNVPTTVFTPVEYSSCGLAEEQAIEQFGADKIEVSHVYFQPLEFAVGERSHDKCYVKVISVKPENDKVVGLHFFGPNAGEVMQGLAVAMKCELTLSVLQKTVGIHPTCAEEFVKLRITKRSGEDPNVTAC